MIIQIKPHVRIERIDGVMFPDSLINGEESWNVYELVETGGRHPVENTATSETSIWVKRGEQMTQDDATALANTLGA
jgi:hypothetical protein